MVENEFRITKHFFSNFVFVNFVKIICYYTLFCYNGNPTNTTVPFVSPKKSLFCGSIIKKEIKLPTEKKM